MSKPFSFGAIDVRLEAESDPRPARAEDDTPFRVLLAADFTGRAARGLVETGAALGERKAFRVDLDSLDATIARLAPQVRLRDGDVIRLRELDDFLPDTLFARIARFATLKDASDADAKRRTTSRPAAGLLDRILDGAPQEEAPVVEAAPDGPTELMRTILGSSAFRELEAAWRGVDFLLRRLDVDGPLTLHLVDLSPEELRTDLLAGDDLSKTGLHRLLVEKTVGTPGAHPWAAFVVLGSFGPSPSDAEALGRLAKIAARRRGPPSSPGPNRDSSAAPRSPRLPIRTTGPSPRAREPRPGPPCGASPRRSTSASPCRASSFVSPTARRRTPSRRSTSRSSPRRRRTRSTSGEARPSRWHSSSARRSSRTAGAFVPGRRRRSPASRSRSSTQDGEKHAVPCAETLFTVRAAEAVTAKSLMPIVTMKGTDTVRLAIFQSIAEPYAALKGLWG